MIAFGSWTETSTRAAASDAREALRAGQHQIQHLPDRLVYGRVLDHRDVEAPGAVEQQVLDHPDLRHPLEVLLERAQPVRRGVTYPEVASVQILVADRDDALDDESIATVDGEHPRDDVHPLEYHRPALGERAVDRRLDAHQDVAGLVEKAEQRSIVSEVFVSTRQPELRLEARVVHRRHELPREEGAHRLSDEVRRGDARDAQAMRGLGGERRLARSRRAADEEEDREVEALQCLEAA